MRAVFLRDEYIPIFFLSHLIFYPFILNFAHIYILPLQYLQDCFAIIVRVSFQAHSLSMTTRAAINHILQSCIQRADIRLYVWTFLEKKSRFQINVHIWEHSESQRHLTSSFCLRDFQHFFYFLFLSGSEINIHPPVTTQWSQPANQKQDASISCNLQDKCKRKHDGIKISTKLVSSYVLWGSVISKHLLRKDNLGGGNVGWWKTGWNKVRKMS